MTRMTVLEACNAAMAHALEHDDDVLLLGEDVGTAGGIFRASQGLAQRFGPQRVIDTPLDEKGILAHAIGMALYGARPIAEVQFSGFIHDAFEQIMFCGAKYRWLTGGAYTCPLTVRAPSFGGIKGGFWHSQSPESYFVHGGGMKIVVPSTPDDAYRLLLAAIRDPDPVLVLEPVPLYRALAGEVEDDGRSCPIGEAEVVRSGTDVTLVTYGPMRHVATKLADELARDRIDVEVIDLRTIVPVDLDAVVASVKRTGRLVVAHEATRSLGFGAELVALAQERAFGWFHAPAERVAAPDLPYSFSTGDEYFRPNADRIAAAVRRTVEFAF
jgi:pyruvate dehydrogenase E1 component beta subunit